MKAVTGRTVEAEKAAAETRRKTVMAPEPETSASPHR
jgi:hypothetical protein